MLIMTDKAPFHLDGYLNGEKCPYWVAKNPRELYQLSLHSNQVWSRVSRVERIQHCVTIIEDILNPQLEEHEYDIEAMWFQDGGVAAHTAGRMSFVSSTSDLAQRGRPLVPLLVWCGCVRFSLISCFQGKNNTGINPKLFRNWRHQSEVSLLWF